MKVLNEIILLLTFALIASCNSSQSELELELELELEILKQENESLEKDISKAKAEFILLKEELFTVKDKLNQKIEEVQDIHEVVSSDLMNLSYYINDLQYSINYGWDDDHDWDYTVRRMQNNLNNMSYTIDEILSNY